MISLNFGFAGKSPSIMRRSNIKAEMFIEMWKHCDKNVSLFSKIKT